MSALPRFNEPLEVVYGVGNRRPFFAVSQDEVCTGFDVLPEQRWSEQAYRVRTVLSRALPFLSGLPVELLGHLLKLFPVHFPIPCVSISA